MYEALIKYLDDGQIEYRRAELSEYSTVKIGGAALCVFPKSENELVSLSSYLYRNKLKHRILGAMSNTLAPSEGYDGVAVITRKLNMWHIDDERLFASCGVRLSAIATDLIKLGLSGYEELVGIPGLVGGLIYENAGAFSKCIADILEYARVYDKKEDKILELKVSDMGFAYRQSILSQNHNLILLSAVFKLHRCENQDKITERLKVFSEKRRLSQPLEYPSLGSVFKRPAVGFAGAYIENAGLKGCSFGDAEISEKHAGFIINKGKATSDDFISLLNTVKDTVYKKFSVELEEEVEILQ